ncbi:MAG: polyprenyl synthetase family protein [Herbinix sp.]|nr:polyprenyl synthetase family protein [Herbinix sp.]
MINNNRSDDIMKVIRYEEAINLVKDKIDQNLSNSPFIIRKYTKHLISSKGKFIRANSLIICAEDKQGNIHPNAITLAAAIEILHLATLVHDDVIDNADLRRGDITLWKKYGKRTAVICGDYLLCVSLKLAASVTNKLDYLSIDFPDYMSKLCLGELNQHINNGNLDLSVYQYLKIISGKTAALFEASFFAGAYFSGSNEKEINKYRRLGFLLGMIFQLTDDCIDFEKTEAVAMKPVQSDYEQGVITLPLIHALHEIASFKDKAVHSGLSRSEIKNAVDKSGGLVFTRMLVQKYYSKALRVIEDLEITETKKEKLISILNKVSRLS